MQAGGNSWHSREGGFPEGRNHGSRGGVVRRNQMSRTIYVAEGVSCNERGYLKKGGSAARRGLGIRGAKDMGC